MDPIEKTIGTLIKKLDIHPDDISFNEVIDIIDTSYDFKPTKFINGDTKNEAGSNNGSCKIFAFAKLQGLTKNQTLNLFGDYYQIDVLENAEGDDHANIRNFMRSGWDGIKFEAKALVPKE